MDKLWIMLTLVALSGCSSAFSKFYHDQTGGANVRQSSVVQADVDKPKLYYGVDVKADYIRMSEDGFELIGYSSFNASAQKEKGAIRQARKVHASIVLLYVTYTNTVSGVRPLMLPDNQSSTTSLYGNAYGPGGSTTFSGTAHTTTQGSQIAYMPYSVNLYDYMATYWVKMKPPIFGVIVEDLSTETRRKIGSNKGQYVIGVIKNSPAFRADILRGDILRKIGDVEVSDRESFIDAITRGAGQTVHVLIYRDGEEIEKDVTLNEESSVPEPPVKEE